MSDKIAEDCVIEAIEKLVSQGGRAYVHSVPNKAAELLEASENKSKLDINAWDRIIKAIDSLQNSNRIECHNEPYKDWKIVDHSGFSDAENKEFSREIVLETIENLNSKPGERAYTMNVPDIAAKSLKQRLKGRLALNEAEKWVNLAIAELTQDGRIKSPDRPYEDWKVVR